MKNLLIALVVATVAAAGFSANAIAEQPISDNLLAQMGLDSMQTMSDSEGMQVRGKLFDINFYGGNTNVGQVAQINNTGQQTNVINIGNVAVNSNVGGVFRFRR